MKTPASGDPKYPAAGAEIGEDGPDVGDPKYPDVGDPKVNPLGDKLEKVAGAGQIHDLKLDQRRILDDYQRVDGAGR